MLFADLDAWALPINTILLILLAMTNFYIAKYQRGERRDVSDLKRSLGLTKREGKLPDTGERRRATDQHD